MIRIEGKLVSLVDGVSAASHNVLANLRFRLAEGVSVPVSGSARAGADERFRMEIDAAGDPQGPVEVLVSAPNGVLLERRGFSLDELTKPVEIEVRPEAPFTVEESDVPALGERLRVTGRVIDETGKTVPAGLPVVIWVVDRPEAAPRPVLIAQTHGNGAFGGDWPADVVVEAFGRVDGGPPIPVPLDEDSRIVRDILLVTRVTAEEKGECDCEAATPRAPDAIDLTSSPETFSQDLGAGCVDLTMPNRALEEFSYFFVVRTSEPAVQGVTLGTRRTVPRDLLVDLLGASLSATMLRGDRLRSASFGRDDLQLDVDSALQLVRTDVVPRPEAIERAAWLSEVAHTKSLIDASMRTRASRALLDADSAIDWDDTPTIYPAIEIAHGHLLHYREVWRADGYSLGDMLYSLPLAPGQRRQIAVVNWEARQRAAREESLEFEEELDALLERDRDVREIVGSDLRETIKAGSRNTTWGAAAGIGGGFLSGAFGIFGGIAGGGSGSDTRSWQDSARTFSADSLQQLRDRVGQRASSVRTERSTVVQTVAQGETLRAETEVVANYNRCHAITVAYFEVLRHFLVSHELADVQECLFVPLPIRMFDRGKALRWREVLTRFLKNRTLQGGFDAIERIADAWVGWDFPVSRYSEEAPLALEGELRVSFILPRPRDDKDGEFQLGEWANYRDVLPMFARDLFGRVIENAIAENKSRIAARDEAFRREVAPQIATNVINRLRFAYVGADGGQTEIPLDATLVSTYSENAPLYVRLNPAGPLPQIPRENIAYFRISYDGTPLPPDAQVVVHNGRLRYRTDHMTALLFDNARIIDDLRGGDPVLIGTPTSANELRNPRREDLELADRLVAHLNDHLEFYHQALWRSLDPQKRYMLLDALEVPGQQGRSVASLCTNELIGIVGNSLVLPVAPGQRLNPSVIATDAEGNPIDVRNAYATPPSPQLRISVPTRGVYAEAIAGSCNSCEKFDDTRYWRWSTEGLLAPPEIQPVDTSSRGRPAPDLTPTPLPTPLVSIQNAPDVPDPFGLGAAFGLLAKPDLFRDITGLEGTQKNAIGAFEAALGAASAVGGEAAKLARQAELSKNASRMVDRIEQAVRDDLLTPEAAKRLTESVLGGLVGRDEPQTENPVNDETVGKAVDSLSQAESGSLKVETPSETVELSFDDAPVVGGDVVPQAFVPSDPHDKTDIKITLELTYEGRAPYPENNLADDLTPFVIEGDFLREILGAQAATQLEKAGLLLSGPTGGTYRIRRQLRIVYPATSVDKRVLGEGKLPVVIIAHGTHPVFTQGGSLVESHLGYRYLQDALAARNIISVSVDANLANAIEPAYLDMRARLIISALDTLAVLNDDKTSRFHQRLDLQNVGLFGHSRGGDAAVMAATRIAKRFPAPLYTVKFVCALAPSDLSGQAKADQRLVIEPVEIGDPGLPEDVIPAPFFAVLYGTQDGDATGTGGARALGGTGFRHYDRAKTEKSMVFLDSIGHNRFNTEWVKDRGLNDSGTHPDDERLLFSEDLHHKLLEEYVVALAKWKLQGDSSDRALFDGTRVNNQGVPASVQWSFGKTVSRLDDMERSNSSRALTNAVVSDFALLSAFGRPLILETNHQTRVLAIQANLAAPVPAAMVLNLTSTQRDWRKFSLFTVRATSICDLSSETTIQQGPIANFDVTIRDGAGTATVLRRVGTQGSRPTFHRAIIHLADIDPVVAAGTETRITTKEHPVTKKRPPHNMLLGDIALIQETQGGQSFHQTVTAIESPTSFRVAGSIPQNTGKLAKLENVSVHRLETFSFRVPTNLGDVRSVEITPAANFPLQIVIDSLELIEP